MYPVVAANNNTINVAAKYDRWFKNLNQVLGWINWDILRHSLNDYLVKLKYYIPIN